MNNVYFIMGTKERKARERQEMRKTILKAALSLFIEAGFENTTIRNIAKRIEYSPGTIYLYFLDKNQILLELQKQGFVLLNSLQKEIQNEGDPIERLRKHAFTYIHFAINNPEYYDLMFIMASSSKNPVQEEAWIDGKRSYDLIKDNVSACISAGYMKGTSIDIATFMAWSFVHGISSLFVKNHAQIIPTNLRESIMIGAVNRFIENVKSSKV
jgi:AcrR family transcriptional regulator